MAEEEAVEPKSPWPVIVLFGLIFLPGGILAFALWGMLRFGRHRPSVVGLVASLVGAISVAIVAISISGISEKFQLLLQDFDGGKVADLAILFAPLWLGVSLILGAFAGYGFAVYSARQMKKNPYLTQLAGSWRHNFKYRRTPAEFLKRKKNIRALKNGLLTESSKAPLGLDERTDEVVFRYDTEARKHTFMVGASGSGKALHAATWIPTQKGFKRVGRVRVGDVLFDEQGRPTKVTAVYQPKTEDHYQLTLSNGEVVKACGDHLWSVKEAGGALETKVVSTRELALNPQSYYISALRNPVFGVERPMVNTKLLGAWIASGALKNGHILKRDALTREVLTEYDSFIDDLQKMGWMDGAGDTLELDYDWIMTSVPARERALDGAITVAGSYTLDGQTKLTLPSKEVANYLRSVVFSLGIQPSVLEEFQGAYSFRFTNKKATRKRHSGFSISLGEITRKGAPARSLVKFVSIEPIEDNPEHYFCFTVDSPSHLFLFGRTFTPTHNTITMQSLIYADIENGKTVVVIDFKRSPKFASKLAAWAEDNGREFYHFVNGDMEEYDIPRSKGQCYYDPLKSGTPTSKADMVLGMREYDSNAAVYKAAMQQLLQVLFGMTKFADKASAPSIDWRHGGMYQLASVMSGNGLGELAAANVIQVAPGQSKYTYTMPGGGGINGAKEVFVNSPVAKQATELSEALKSKGPLTQAREELQGQMRTILASEYGKWMKTGNSPEDREIDLFKQTSEEGNVILFSLNSDSEPEFAQYVGSMIFSDLTNISALRRNSGAKNQVNIYVDEFQAVPPTSVTALLEKSRESSMALTIAQQSFDQVVASAKMAGEAYLNSILDTCSNFIAHAGSTEKSATRLSEILGKEYVTVYSKTNDSDSSFLSVNWSKNQSSKVAAREEERWKFSPGDFMSLSSPDPANNFKASAVWVTKTSADPKYSQKGGATARTVWMVPAEKVLVEYYEGAEKPRVRRKPVANPEFEDFATVEQIAVREEKESRIKQAAAMAHYEQEDDFEQVDQFVEEDDEWGYEELTPEELQLEDELPEFIPPAPVVAEPERESFNIDDLFGGGASAPAPTPRPEVKKPVIPAAQPVAPQPIVSPPAQPPVQTRPGLPTRPGSGLPTRPGAAAPAPKPVFDSEDIALPDI